MNFSYKNKEDGRIGHYAIGEHDTWHGGIHIGNKIYFVSDGEIVAYKIATKYHEEKRNVKKVKDDSTTIEEEVTHYSDSFILVKHKYTYVIKENEENKHKEFTFYSLYAHLSIKDEIFTMDTPPAFLHWSAQIKGYEKLKTKRTVRSGINLRKDGSTKQTPHGIIPYDCSIVVYPINPSGNWYKTATPKLLTESSSGNTITIELVTQQITGYFSNKSIKSEYDIVSTPPSWTTASYNPNIKGVLHFRRKDGKFGVPYRNSEYTEELLIKNVSTEDAPQLEKSGSLLFENNNIQSACIGLIPTGSTVRLLEKSSNEWFKVNAKSIYVLTEDTESKTVYRKKNSEEGFIGWCKNANAQFDDYVELEYDKVVELDKPIQVSAGELLGHASKYEALGSCTNRYVAAHIEVFSNDDVPAFLADMEKLITDKNKTIEIKKIKNVFKTESFTYLENIQEVTKENIASDSKCMCDRDLTEEDFKKIGIKESIAKEYREAINETFKDYNIKTCLRKVHFLAQVMHESSNFNYTSEIGVSDTDYEGFKGRGLIQITLKANYEAYGKYVNEDFTTTDECKKKLEKAPHSIKSAGWFWDVKSKLNAQADKNDLINITRTINGGFNGYNDRLNKVTSIVSHLAKECKTKIDTNYNFTESTAYNNGLSSFAWALWHDSECGKKGCTYDDDEAIKGYEKCVELDAKQTNRYGIHKMSIFSSIVYYDKDDTKKKKPIVNIKEAAELRLKTLKNK